MSRVFGSGGVDFSNRFRPSLAVSGRLQPSPAVSGRLQPSPAVSSLKGASGSPLKIVNCPFANCQLDSNQVASKSDPVVFHWQSISTWQVRSCLVAWLEIGDWGLVVEAWLPGSVLDTGDWGLVAGGSGARA